MRVTIGGGYTMIKKAQDSPNWKGSGASYRAIHSWLWNEYGPPIRCERCGVVEGRLEYALKKGSEYTRKLKDYSVLCPKCHRIYDRQISRCKQYCVVCKRYFPCPTRKDGKLLSPKQYAATKCCSDKCLIKLRLKQYDEEK